MLQLEVADDGPGMVDATRLRTAAASASAIRASDCRCCMAIAARVAVHNTEPGLRVALTFPAERAVQLAGVSEVESNGD